MKDKATEILWRKTRRGIVNSIYGAVAHLTRGIFRDDDWSHVARLWDAFRGFGMEVAVEARDGGYFTCPGADFPSGKRYHFTLGMNNIEGVRFDFSGILTCSFCGSVSNPMECYDMSLEIE